MTNTVMSFHDLSDERLVAEVSRLAMNERHATARLIACLIELDARRLYLAQGCSSLFTYCTQKLHLSEHAAYGRIEAARAARRLPDLLDRLADGSLTLTVVALLAPHLTSENYSEVLNAARHKSKRDVEQLVARLRPQPPAPSTIRKLPVSKAPLSANFQMPVPASSMTARVAELPIAPLGVRPKPTAVKPLASEQFKVQFTVSRETYERLRRVQDLVRHTIPDGDPAKIFDRALSLLLAHLERSKLAATGRPRASGRAARSDARYIPAAMKREVWRRDGGRCKFVGTEGRCGETGFLEFHHVVPFAAGGKTTANNLELRCRAHNAYEAELHFGLHQPLLIRESAIGFS